MPSVTEAVDGLLEQMAVFPDDTIFFLNTWCLGYVTCTAENHI